MNDISDHLPVFVVLNINNKIDKTYNNPVLKHTRLRNEDSLNAFKQSLVKQNWTFLMEETNVNAAYDNFLSTFMHLYNTHCPIIVTKCNKKTKTRPWITKGLNACKKKNLLYKQFLKERSIQSENIKHIKIN